MAIEAARAQIRPWRMDDADALHRLVRESHASLSKWLPWCHADYGLADARSWIDQSLASWKARSAFPFAVVDEDAGVLLGSAGLSQLDTAHRIANLGYWVGTPFLGQGVATDAARHVVRFGFDDLGLQRILVRVRSDNPASLGVARKLGAKVHAIVRDDTRHDGEPHDVLIHALATRDIA